MNWLWIVVVSICIAMLVIAWMVWGKSENTDEPKPKKVRTGDNSVQANPATDNHVSEPARSGNGVAGKIIATVLVIIGLVVVFWLTWGFFSRIGHDLAEQDHSKQGASASTIHTYMAPSEVGDSTHIPTKGYDFCFDGHGRKYWIRYEGSDWIAVGPDASRVNIPGRDTYWVEIKARENTDVPVDFTFTKPKCG